MIVQSALAALETRDPLLVRPVVNNNIETIINNEQDTSSSTDFVYSLQ